MLKSLLSKGYFPRDLPPVFTTQEFGSKASEILASWRKAGIFSITPASKMKKSGSQRIRRGAYTYGNLPRAEAEAISKPKRNFERRYIHITHPIPQSLLAWEIVSHWRQLQKWLARQEYSEERIIISDSFERALKDINFPIHRAKTGYIEAASDWLVKTDISRFYPSIYTHSIAWAAYGKAQVKSDLTMYSGTFADRLDLLVRHCNQNQTVGIPIGPETSRILAEIISSRIDTNFRLSEVAKNVKKSQIDRLQDDWYVGTGSMAVAEKVLSTISRCYNEFGLEINGSKTSISHIISSRQDSWKSDIAAFLSDRRYVLAKARLEEYLSMSLRLQVDFPNEPVVNYALATIEGRRFSSRDLAVLESFLLKAAAVSPISLDRICRIILNIDRFTGGLSKGRIIARFTELLEKQMENGALYEVIWLLYTLRGLKKPFRSRGFMQHVENVQSSVIRLLLLDMDSKGLCGTQLPINKWEGEIRRDRVLTDWTWLFAYEGIRKGWLRDQHSVMTTPFFASMDARDVSFYDPTKNVRKSQSVKRTDRRKRQADIREVTSMLKDIRGVDFVSDLDWYDY